MKYWKIGSRWNKNGDKSKSVLNIFYNNNIVFAKEENNARKILNEVKKNDVIAIADGHEIVAIGIVKRPPTMLNKVSLKLDKENEKIFSYDEEKDDTKAVEVDILCTTHIIYNHTGRFCEIQKNEIKEQINAFLSQIKRAERR